MQWKPLIYKSGPRGEEQDRECKHTIQSNCGKYRIRRDKLDGSGLYTLWHLNASDYLYASGTSAWRSITSAQADAIHAALLQARLDAITLYRINRRDRRDYDDQIKLITEAEHAIGAHEALDL